MTRESDWARDRERLLDDRDRARRRWRGAVDGISARARDPFGLGQIAADHPVVTAAVGAAAAALLARLLGGPRRAAGADDTPAPAPRPASSPLRDALVGAVLPRVLRWLEDGATTPPAPADRTGPAPEDTTPRAR